MRFNGLDLNLLVVLDALLDEQNITRAGERLFLSQPATSAALSRLRAYFEDDLLIQIGRRMVRTPMGETLAQPVRDLLTQMRTTLENRNQFKPQNANRTFKIMASDYVGMVLMPDVSRRMNEVAPHCALELFSLTDDAINEIDRGHIDFLLLPEQQLTREHPSTPLFDDLFVCVACRETGPQTLSLDDYKQLSHVLVRWGNEHRTPTVDAWFLRSFDFERRVDVTTHTFNSVPPYLMGTRRIATMHRRLAELWAEPFQLRILPVPWESPGITIGLQWSVHRQHDPGLAWLRNLIIDAAAGLG
ncbi:nodulation protein NfeD [Pseudomonas syringae pv. syringae PD2774]|uniref:LysR family transcriptional regulator n=1 Tax=Pseudomonas syringae TaxID=317 RepID=UPI000735FFCC|nr:LysR family transcriptional regulator [Pseudomonas syringae]KTB79618.1 nodulation protein NfeD [Pseudomonas syringae pv. syringae PD2774]